jgi:hypothetical protein
MRVAAHLKDTIHLYTLTKSQEHHNQIAVTVAYPIQQKAILAPLDGQGLIN